jgi:hypothetical protein
MPEKKLIFYNCPHCGTKLFEYDGSSEAFFKMKCRNRHCGKIIPIWLDGGHEDKKKK